jgi:hypothetical protein
MKLGKEEIQKIVLGVLLLFGLVYSYFSLLLGPLVAREEAYDKSIKGLGPATTAANAQIARTNQMEKEAPGVAMVVYQVNAMIPAGSPVAWFPTRIADFFKSRGIDRVTTRLNSETTDKRFVGYRKLTWGIDVPKVGFVQFASAIAALENAEPLIEITSMQIDAGREDVEMQHVLITVNNLVKQ